MSEQSAFPLSWPIGWPRTKYPARSRFGTYSKKPTVAAGRDALMSEVRMLGASRVVISTNISLRRDGLPYSNQRDPSDTGVAVYFLLNAKPRVLACDKWNTVGDNLWAIAKHIEALRGQERWGVGSVEQAFAGYAALPERAEADNCWQVLGIPAGSSQDAIKAAYREKAKRAHPDAGGSDREMARLNQARDTALKGGSHA